MRAHIIENGVVINTIEVDDLQYPVGANQILIDGGMGGIGWTWDGSVLTAPAITLPVQPPKTVFSSLEYLSKFTDAEYQAARTGPMAIQRGLDMLIAAQFIDLNDPRVGEYLAAMVTAGIIDETRKTELLTPQAA
ncbi:hypothetical protein [Paralcaligenes ginsengisoli]